MNEQEFIDKLIDVMDTEEDLQMDTVLAEVEEWDSLSYVSFLALCSKVSKTHVEPQEVRDARTVKDLYELINR